MLNFPTRFVCIVFREIDVLAIEVIGMERLNDGSD